MAQGHHNEELLPLLQDAIEAQHTKLLNGTQAADAEFTRLYASDPAAAVESVTAFGVAAGQGLMADWLKFWMFLFSRFRDGGILTAPTLPTCVSPGRGCTARPIPQVLISALAPVLSSCPLCRPIPGQSMIL